MKNGRNYVISSEARNPFLTITICKGISLQTASFEKNDAKRHRRNDKEDWESQMKEDMDCNRGPDSMKECMKLKADN